jgi:hypothetical protein
MSESKVVKVTDLVLYQTHSLALDSERAAIWARYNAFLVANSFLITLLVKEIQQDIVLSVVGLMVCAFWFVIHWDGYRRFVRRLVLLRTAFEVTVPVAGAGGRWNRAIDPIFLGSTAAILLVAFLYFHLNTALASWALSKIP